MGRLSLAETRRRIGRLAGDSAYRELLFTSAQSLAVRLTGVATGFLVTWYTARYFSTDALGVVSICIGILSLAGIFAKLGHDVALMRYISGYAGESRMGAVRNIYRNSVRVILPFSLLITALLFFTADWMAIRLFHKPHLASVLRWNSLILLPLTMLQINSECLRGVKRIVSYTYFQTAAVSVMALVLLILSCFTDASENLPVYIQFVSITVAFLLSQWSWYSIVRGHLPETYELPDFRRINRTAAPMFTTTLMQLIMSWTGILILAAFRDEANVGVFNALVRISVFTNITILAVNGLMMTRFAAAYHSGDLTTLRRQSSQASRLIFFTALPLFLVLFLFPAQVLSVFGEGFSGYESQLRLLLVSQFVVVMAGLPGQLLNMTGRQQVLRNIAIVSAAVNVVAALLFVPETGIDGAVWSQLAGTLVWNCWCVIAAYREFGFLTIVGFTRD
ncbi:MAG: hypothetical protein RL021_246 [Bacteroidota bacterium]|jgi:O-antigen/teichoic acid export membrane protein